MSTRANINIKYKDRNTYLYSHYDGYPDGVGEEVKTIVEAEDWDPTMIMIELTQLYEVTTSIHGDIDYLYIVDLNNNQLICRHVLINDKNITDREEPQILSQKG